MRKVGLTPKYEHFARPYLHELLNSLAEDYDFAIWSQTGMSGIIRKLTALQIIGPNCRQNYPVVFILDDKSMVNTHLERGDRFYSRKQEIKALSFIWHKFSTWYSKSNTIHLDDLKRNFVLNTANGLLIPAFKCTQVSLTQDRDLLFVARYLLSIARSESDFTELDHTSFRDCRFAFQYSDFLDQKSGRIPFVGVGNRLDA